MTGEWVHLDNSSLDVGCGCGQSWSGADAAIQFQSHECLLVGVALSVDDMLEMVNDPTGSRRAHKADIANGVEGAGFVVQPVFPRYAWENGGGVHFAYTIGLWPAHPELMVRGYGDHCAAVATGLAQEVVQRLLPTEPGIWPMGDEGRVQVLPWSGDPGDFGQAMAHHGTDEFGRVLMVLADDDGLLPQDGGAHVLQLWGLPEWSDEMMGRVPHE